jgi:hypothetical protein
MSRFSLAEALALGWKLAHKDENSVRFEKQLNAPGFPFIIVNEQGSTMGLALESVFAYEYNLRRNGYYGPE